jgi:hypothetical protein
MSGSDCSTRPAPIAQGATMRMDAGRIGADERSSNCRLSGDL